MPLKTLSRSVTADRTYVPTVSNMSAGFFFSYNASSLKPNITEAAWRLEADYPDEPWYIIGHSMGSAMATICALDLKASGLVLFMSQTGCTICRAVATSMALRCFVLCTRASSRM